MLFPALLTAVHLAVTPSACVRVNLTQNVMNNASTNVDAVAATAAQVLRSRGWTVYTIASDSWECSGELIIGVGGTSVMTNGVAAFTVLVTAYEKMDSKRKAGWWFWAEHHNQYGTWTAVAANPGEGNAQFLEGVSKYTTEVATNVEQDQ
jgi:hypothetical protein